eukprot:jgi/Hompol1/4708/HPOL_002298-RA
MLLLGVSNLRLIVENYIKYGLLLKIPFTSVQFQDLKWSVAALTFLVIPVTVAFLIEHWAAQLIAKHQRHKNSSPAYIGYISGTLHTINTTIALVVPTWISWSLIWHPAASSAPLFASVILFLKLISFALVHADLRSDALHRGFIKPIEDDSSFDPQPLTDEHSETFDPKKCPYPHNVTINNIVYFCFAPTLSYQRVYPRTKRIRKVFLFKRFLELSTALAGMYFLIMQYASPTLRNSIEAIDQVNMPRVIERLLKLSVIRFGDRRFYQPWWNARDVSEYWRLWNSPVYNWGKRHVYLPLILNHGFSPVIALAVVFAISALLHEIIIGVPTHCLNGVAFLGMMGQVPLIFLVNSVISIGRGIMKRPKNDLLFDTIGNYIFWVTFTIVGQPACALLYYTQWFKKNAM